MVRGSCLCGDVAYEAEGPAELPHHCHCSLCRKQHGTAFTSAGAFAQEGFRWARGEAGIRRYESSPGNQRAFCGRCGSPLPAGILEDRIFLPLGPLEGDFGPPPAAHIFVASKAPWYDIADGLPRFDEFPPPYETPQVAARDVPRPRAGALGGSCLCGAVAFEVEGSIDRFHHCHCARCRRARGAAHASNLFLGRGSLHWLRGENMVETYRLPEAERFAQTFCRQCSGKLPRQNPQLRYVAVPAGSLDADPGARPQRHIFVGSKAAWFEIADRLPQATEYPPQA